MTALPLLLFILISFSSIPTNAKILETLLLRHVEYRELNFYVGNVHCDFVQAAEKHVMQFLYDSISKIPDRIPAGRVSSTPSNFKHPSCLVVDVGANDGFYTQMAASLGCKVISFELQDNCIQIANAASRVNGFNSHQISIHRHPVSDSNNTELSMKISDDYPCSGTLLLPHSHRNHCSPHYISNKIRHTFSYRKAHSNIIQHPITSPTSRYFWVHKSRMHARL